VLAKTSMSKDVGVIDSFSGDTHIRMQTLTDKKAELEREVKVLRNKNPEDIKLKYIKLE
jgi:hypothetical protein